MVGAALGFLFGLPRTRNEAAAEESVVNAAHHAGAASRLARAFAANDNLTKVSDWLTTIVVGLTLINLSSLQGTPQAALGRRVRGMPAALRTAAGTPASRQAL
jgi:hypothetical protein